MFASRLFPSRISLFITLTLLATEFAAHVIGKEYEVSCKDGVGDTTLFTSTIKALLPGDVLLLGPCNYQFEENYMIGWSSSWSPTGGLNEVINEPDRDKFGGSEGVLIKGTGEDPAQTVLKTVIQSFRVNVIFENLTIDGKQSTENVYYTDYDQTIVFRNCVLISGNLSTAYIKAAVWSLSGRLTFIDSEIINDSTSAAEADMGVWVYAYSDDAANKMNLMRSSIDNFPIGLFGGGWAPDTQKSIQVHKTMLWSNTVECCVDYTCDKTGAEMCENKSCPLEGQTVNTPVGKSTIAMNKSVDLLGDYGRPIRQTYLPLRISFPKVQTGGYTFTYKLLSAHPALPTHTGKQYHPGNAAPQYFQFDSTATLSNKKKKQLRIGFDRSVIDSNFDNPENIKAFFSYNGKVWKKKPLLMKKRRAEGVRIYQVRLPKLRRLKSLIAFGEI
mmetsp:Transcript_19800/g.23647  ORF Transcript_19800/g.23647 Transcript_19800/m.23647 type:complete len:443 (+) Transcript_19800:142-1470(+)